MRPDRQSLPGQNGASAPSDADLARAAAQGDKRAFVEIVARHQAMVCGIAMGILGDFAASEDAGQEAFLTAWRKIHELREPERLRSWLAQIARNAALMQLRRRRGHEALEDDLPLQDESPAPDESAASREEAALVLETLSKLPETYRLPLVLFYREGKSVSAVATALDLSEDAVKQRLSRGREMLHERMSGLIESSLTRTRPSAIFTMAVAAAIGALAAPAAVAGAAFCAASATATSTASSSSFLAAMSTSKALALATAVIMIVCVPIGYRLPASLGRDSSALPSRQAEPPPGSIAKVETPHFEDSELFAEWRNLHERLGTNAESMPALYKAIGDLKEPRRRQSLRTALIAEWTEVDPAGGMKFIFGKGPDNNQRRQFFEEWMDRDPRAAVDSLLAIGSASDSIAKECLSEIARQVPSRVPEIASRLPKPERYWDTSVRDAFAIVAEGGLQSAVKAADTVTGPNREQALAGIAKAWGKTDLGAAITWARALPEGHDRDEIIRAALLGRASVDPASALESASVVPPGGTSMYFASTTGARVLSEASKTDFDTTVRWVAAHPGRFAQEDLLGLSREVTDRLNQDATAFLDAHYADGTLNALLPAVESALLNAASGQRGAIWDWLKTQPQSEATIKLRSQVLHSAAYQDPEMAMRFAGDLPAPTEGDKQFQELAQALLNGGNALHRFDGLMATAPDRLRPVLLEQAFRVLQGAGLDDPQQWISRLASVPESSRPQAIEGLARAWAQQAPEQTVGWVESLAPGEGRDRAVGAIVSTWARSDAHSAADWVASLSAGTERDHAAKSLVLSVADQFPNEAWEWAMSISDPATRKDAAFQAANVIASRDPALARQMIEASELSPETKAQLQSQFSAGGKPGTRQPK